MNYAYFDIWPSLLLYETPSKYKFLRSMKIYLVNNHINDYKSSGTTNTGWTVHHNCSRSGLQFLLFGINILQKIEDTSRITRYSMIWPGLKNRLRNINGQLISKGLFKVFVCTKKWTKIFLCSCPSRGGLYRWRGNPFPSFYIRN